MFNKIIIIFLDISLPKARSTESQDMKCIPIEFALVIWSILQLIHLGFLLIITIIPHPVKCKPPPFNDDAKLSIVSRYRVICTIEAGTKDPPINAHPTKFSRDGRLSGAGEGKIEVLQLKICH